MIMERTLELQYDEIVIGADLSALLYSYYKKVPIIYNRHIKPYKYANKLYDKQTELWEYLMFVLSFNGYCPFSNLVQTIRIDEENTLKITTKNNFSSDIKYNKLVISDDYNIDGLPQPISKTDINNLVVDFMAICQRNIGYSEVGSFTRDDQILFDVNFTNKYVLDRKHQLVIGKSIITDEQLKNDEFSESYTRLRFLRHMYPKVKEAKHIKREIHSFGKNIYNLPENIEILTTKPENIIKNKAVDNAEFLRIERILNGEYYKESFKSGTPCWGNPSSSTAS